MFQTERPVFAVDLKFNRYKFQMEVWSLPLPARRLRALCGENAPAITGKVIFYIKINRYLYIFDILSLQKLEHKH